MLLTIVAFMIILKEDLPALKEPSILDKYLMFIMLYVFALGLNFVFVDPLEFEDDDESHHWTTNPSVWVFFGIWLWIHCVFAVYAVVLYKREVRKLLHSKEEVDAVEFVKTHLSRSSLDINGTKQNSDHLGATRVNTVCVSEEFDMLVADRIRQEKRL